MISLQKHVYCFNYSQRANFCSEISSGSKRMISFQHIYKTTNGLGHFLFLNSLSIFLETEYCSKVRQVFASGFCSREGRGSIDLRGGIRWHSMHLLKKKVPPKIYNIFNYRYPPPPAPQIFRNAPSPQNDPPSKCPPQCPAQKKYHGRGGGGLRNFRVYVTQTHAHDTHVCPH